VEALEVHPEDVLGGLAGLVLVLRELDTAGLAPSADLYLRFHGDRIPDLLCSGQDLVDALRELCRGRRDPGVGEDLLRLILVQFHTRIKRSRRRLNPAGSGRREVIPRHEAGRPSRYCVRCLWPQFSHS